MRTYFLIIFIVFGTLLKVSAQQQGEDAYIRTLTERSQKIVSTLDVKDSDAFQRVTNILVNQYRSLGLIHDGSDSEEVKKLKLYDLHCEFIGKLGA